MKTQDDDDALRMFLQDEANGYFWVGLTKLFAEAECKAGLPDGYSQIFRWYTHYGI